MHHAQGLRLPARFGTIMRAGRQESSPVAVDRPRKEARMIIKLRARRALLIAAAGLAASIVFQTGADARRPLRERAPRNYSIVGELSATDIEMLWAPARYRGVYRNESRTGRRFYRASRPNSLANWLPDEAIATPAARLAQDEQKVKLLRGMRDRDGDGIPDKEDVYPWDSTRW
jgi:hypothetical protein